LLKGKGISLALVLVLLAALALVGCSSSKTAVSADEVVQDALAAQAEVENSRVDITIDASVKGAMGETELDVSLDGTVTGDMDWANKKMKGHMGMNVGLSGEITMALTITADMYAFDNVSYMQMTMMGNKGDWAKDSLPIDFWQTLDNTQLINGILQSTEAEHLKEEKVGGVSCYVLQLTPDIAALQQMLSQQSSDEEEIPNIDDLISNLSIKVWVAKDTSYVTKIEMELSADIPSEVLGGAAGGEGLDVNLTITMLFSNFNKSVPIQLPAEAQDAQEGFELPFDISGFF
jgi:outer membrane lipoprotein-sorting protein